MKHQPNRWALQSLTGAASEEMVPEHEIAEEGVALAHSEVVQQGLRHVAGVLEEAGEAGKHLHDLQRRQIVRLLHVLNARAQTFFLCRRRTKGHKFRHCLHGLRLPAAPPLVPPWMYLTTLTLRPCREMVVSTSPALLLQGRLWGGHQEVMALKSSWRSSFWASSSAGDTNVHSFTRI